MKVITNRTYGSADVLKIEELETPAPKENEVLIRVHATSVNYGDLIARNFKAVTPREFNMPGFFWLMAKLAFGLQKPKITILGSQFAGEVEAIGTEVQKYQSGDQVFGYLGQNMGAYAEYISVPENAVMAKTPVNMSNEEAVILSYGPIMALSLLRKMNIQPGQKVLVNGASGSIGAAAVQIAKHYGAEVTGVCGTPRMDFVHALGADHVIDYTQQDFTQGAEQYDLIFDVLGKSSFAKCKRVLKANGRLLYASFKLKQLIQMLWTSLFGNQKVICAMAPGSLDDLLAVKDLAVAGHLKAIIDKTFPMEQAAAAHAYVESGQKKGDVVITM
ncbi:MAG: NAD(P)-dependent alcohol dehydrogenase [Anaerolineaceae bacterium]|nr:NAD(P)-dependent alcohol dehydrogenase [Anaerolineaceae bacterium]